MNRRAFLTAMAGFAILPPATTYARLWRAQATGYNRNDLGIYELLKDCGKTVSIEPIQPLDMDQLFKDLYAIKKHRDANPYFDPNRITVWGKPDELLLSECRRVGIRVEPCLKTL